MLHNTSQKSLQPEMVMNLSIHLDANLNHEMVEKVEEIQIKPTIEPKSLNVYYGDFLAVRDVDITIQKQ
jgi:hypothetical protein